jgi:hypothetical protein
LRQVEPMAIPSPHRGDASTLPSAPDGGSDIDQLRPQEVPVPRPRPPRSARNGNVTRGR